jgi:hypothetical protein
MFMLVVAELVIGTALPYTDLIGKMDPNTKVLRISIEGEDLRAFRSIP